VIIIIVMIINHILVVIIKIIKASAVNKQPNKYNLKFIFAPNNLAL